MKKAFVIFLCCFSRIYSLYYGSPNLPDTAKEGIFLSKDCFLGVKVGYQVDNVFDKSLKVANRRSAKKIDVFNYYMQQGVLTVNFIDRFEVYGSMGAIKFHVEPRNTGVIRQIYETNNHFTWGLGGRAILFEFSKAALGLDFKYQAASPYLERIIQNGVPRESTGGAKLRYREWQIGLGLSYAVEMFTPYIGAIYTQSTGQYKHLPADLLSDHKRHFSVNSRKKFGMALGTTLSTGGVFELDIEARMINETAVSAAANVRF